MTMVDVLIGFMIAGGFFVSAIVSRMFRRTAAGVVIGGVAGILVSVLVLYYGLGGTTFPDAAPLE
ncbi:hypothetical protein [Yoonia sp.]|uniref:hypothetical protein n=1 Tax=Yoonia sp. TaxID=2212373 RepID=UPI0019EC2A31|nr:hypothetical protein [Yoonia sp.]MBE0413183.1 hypothetical protein [Yoonia sp.]